MILSHTDQLIRALNLHITNCNIIIFKMDKFTTQL